MPRMRRPARILLLVGAAALAGGAVIGVRLLSAREADLASLTRGFEAASTPSSSFDGRRFLFSGIREPGSAAGIWEVDADGSGARLVTAGNGEPGDPIYLPDGRILYADAVSPGAAGPRALFSRVPGEGEATRLTFGDHRDGAPRLLADGRVLFERRSGPDGPSRLMTIHPDGTLVAAHAGEAPAAPRPGRGARPTRPPMLTSVVGPAGGTGTLLCLDVRESRIPAVAALPPGSIRVVRVSRAEGSAAGEILGEAPVHSDGSFYVEVPADTALRLTLIDAQGAAVASLDTGIWVRPNENRGCIGCHEEPDLAPENRRPLAVAGPPARLAGDAPSGGVAHAR